MNQCKKNMLFLMLAGVCILFLASIAFFRKNDSLGAKETGASSLTHQNIKLNHSTDFEKITTNNDVQARREALELQFSEFRQHKFNSSAVGDTPKQGMLAPENIQRIALENSRSTSNTNKIPSIVLMGDFYIATLERNPNPFRAGDSGVDCWLGVDAWTGELITLFRAGGGIRIINVSKETGAGIVGNNETATAYQQRMFKKLKKLMLNVYYGRPWGSESAPAMISPEDAIKTAESQVAGRRYDKSSPPLSLLVDDLYIVTFWRSNMEDIPNGAAIFDTRVGIDAYTGEYIAMEIAKER